MRLSIMYRQMVMAMLMSVLMISPVQNLAWSQEKIVNLTLAECISKAINHSAALASESKRIDEARAQFTNALSGLLPKASYQFDVSDKQKQHHQELGRFNFKQPLFTGFKEFALMRGAGALRRQMTFTYQRAKEKLIWDVMDAYFLYAWSWQERKIMLDLLALLQQQETQLTQRVKLGQERESQLGIMKARVAKQKAAFIAAQTNSLVYRHMLEFLIGQSVDGAVSLLGQDQAPVQALADYEKVIDRRADVRAAYEGWQEKLAELRAAKSGFWPTVTLEGNYYTKNSSSASQEWDVVLGVDVPLFKGGETRSQVALSRLAGERAKLDFEESKRVALKELRQAYDSWQGAKVKADAYADALKAQEESFAAVQKDYDQQLMNVMDYLKTLEDLQGARRDALLAQADALRAWAEVLTMAGDLHHERF